MPVVAGRMVPSYYCGNNKLQNLFFFLAPVCILPVNFTGPRLNSEKVTKVAV